MKIAYQLGSVLALPTILIWVVVLYATSSSEQSLSNAIEESSAFQAHSVMEEVDRAIYTRITEWIVYSQELNPQEALRQSNSDFDKLQDVQQYTQKMDIAWREAQSGFPTALMTNILNSDLSKEMRTRINTLNTANAFPIYGEVFITNRYGVTIAQTGLTTDYRQDDEEWWKLAKTHGLYVGEINYDESSEIFSTDICLRITDKDGAFVGVLKAVLSIQEAIDIVDTQLSSVIKEGENSYLLFNSERKIIHSSDPTKSFLSDGSSYFDEIVPPSHGPAFTTRHDFTHNSSSHWHLLTYAFSSGFLGFKGLDWCLVIEHEANFVLLPVRELSNNILMIALVATVMALTFGAVVAISLLRRLHLLSEATIALGHGDLDRTVKLGGDDELTQFANLFNHMAAKLKNYINEQKQTEEALRKERDFAESLIETAQAIVLVLDTQGSIVRFNRYMEKLSGYRLEEVQGRDWFTTFIPEHDRNRIHDQFTHALSGIQTCSKINQIVAKDGTRFEIEWRDKVLRQSDGSAIGLLTIGHDITERALLQSQLVQAQKLEAIGQLAAGIAHEINTPIQFIGDNIRFFHDAFTDLTALLNKYGQLRDTSRSLASKSELDAALAQAESESDIEYLIEEVPKSIDQSLEGIDHVARIVRSMKEFSHPGGKTKEMNDLNKAILSTITVTRNEWKYIADVITDLDPSLPMVPVLIGEINQVILNMIINAAHAIQDSNIANPGNKGTITISTRQNDNWVEIHISDTGTGMPERVREKIFNPFFTTKGVGRGTGQGLAIASTVVIKKHGGAIDVKTQEGRGTTFIVRLPIEASVEQHSKSSITS